MAPARHFPLLLYPNLTQRDLTGPYEVFSHAPGAKVHSIWKTRDPVRSETGLTILPDTTSEACPEPDVIGVPGGPGADRPHGGRRDAVVPAREGG